MVRVSASFDTFAAAPFWHGAVGGRDRRDGRRRERDVGCAVVPEIERTNRRRARQRFSRF